jgi:hypothetical protein
LQAAAAAAPGFDRTANRATGAREVDEYTNEMTKKANAQTTFTINRLDRVVELFSGW